MRRLRLVVRGSEDETTKAAEWLAECARRGDLAGLSVTYTKPGGGEDHFCTGLYRTRPAEAVRAALRVSMVLTALEEKRRGKT